METVKAKCRPCGGTGLYPGFAEGPGGAVECGQCGGSGCHTIEYIPFTKRIRRRMANGSKLVTVFVSGPWTTARNERKTITPQEFYQS